VAGLHADEIHLTNGDIISGEVVEKNEKAIVIKTDAMGLVSIKREFVREVTAHKDTEPARPQQEEPRLWAGGIWAGYNEARGNTGKSQLSTEAHLNRKTPNDDLIVKGGIFYSSSNKEMDSQKWYSTIRHAFNPLKRKWHKFYELESDHDRFANVDYRLVPSAGIGYWFSNKADWKALIESAVGLEHTNYRDETADNNEAILIHRGFFEKGVPSGSKVSQDVTLYPSLADWNAYRLHSETTFINPINDKLSLRFSLIDDYNSNPPEETRKNDIRFMSSLGYSF
jgi:putative salt-induced outer membrane protein YdiY